MKVKIEKYPFNTDCAFAITVDDLHPEGKNNAEGLDFGVDFWRSINYLISRHPGIKFTVFTVGNWIDRNELPSGILWPFRKIYRQRRFYTPDTFDIKNPKFNHWIKRINQYVKQGNLEISFHGLHHYNSNLAYPKSQEFLGLNLAKTTEKISEMLEVFNSSGLQYKLGFRPPGWGMTENLYESLQKKHFLYLADRYDFKLPVNQLETIKLYKDLTSFQANCFADQLKRAIEIADAEGIIILHVHIAQTVWGLKWVDKNFAKTVDRIIKEIKLRTLKDVWFCSLAELAQYRIARDKVSYKIRGTQVVLQNNSDYDLSGLTVKINGLTFIVAKIRANKEYLLETAFPNEELVSVVVTVLNGAGSIESCLSSLSDQTYLNLEILVINDGSTDDTLEKINNFRKQSGDKRVRVITQKNLGRAQSKQKGLNLCRGSIVAFCEDDAIYNKDYIKDAVDFFKKSNREVAGVIGPYFILNREDSLWTKAKDLERRRNFINYQPKSAWVYRKEALKSVGGFNKNLEYGEDIEPGIRLANLGYKFVYEDNCRWLHREPTSLTAVLKRRFKGGIGMSLLCKKGIISPPLRRKHIEKILLGILSFLGLAVFDPKLLVVFFPLVFLSMLLLRIKDVWILKKAYRESFWLAALGIYIQYIWWGATLSGLFTGMFMNEQTVNKTLRGR